MPTVTVRGSVTVKDVAAALQEKLGSDYEITTRGTGDDESLRVKRSAAALATVRLEQEGSSTTFRVHGGGLIVSRMVNEFGIAKKVAAAIQESFGSVATDDANPS